MRRAPGLSCRNKSSTTIARALALVEAGITWCPAGAGAEPH